MNGNSKYRGCETALRRYFKNLNAFFELTKPFLCVCVLLFCLCFTVCFLWGVLRLSLCFFFNFEFVCMFRVVTDESMQRLVLIHVKNINYIMLGLGDVIARPFIKKTIHVWSVGTPAVRIDAFLLIYSIAKKRNEKELLKLLKYVYQAYVTVCKRVSTKTMPGMLLL